jgi:glycosyltransferase involved in cell wall biosynthesis
VHFVCHVIETEEQAERAPAAGINLIRFDVGGIAREASVLWWRGFERALCYAFGAWEMIEAKRLRPVDLIFGRSAGLGSTLFMPVSYPRVPIVQYFDQYLHPRSNDLADEDAPRLPEEYVLWRRSANAIDLADLENGVTAWTSTQWQRELYPAEYRDGMQVFRPSIDTRRFKPKAERPRSIAGRTLPADIKVVTFVASALDRLHGFDRFAALCDRILSVRNDVVCIAAGNPITQTFLDLSYHGADYPAALRADHRLREDDRFWILGRLPEASIPALLALSDLHICPERAHPVSTTVLEAMAAGCLILAEDTAPMWEVLEQDRSALTTRFDDLDQAVSRALGALADPATFAPIAGRAAEVARERFDQDQCLPAFAELLARLALG